MTFPEVLPPLPGWGNQPREVTGPERGPVTSRREVPGVVVLNLTDARGVVRTVTARYVGGLDSAVAGDRTVVSCWGVVDVDDVSVTSAQRAGN